MVPGHLHLSNTRYFTAGDVQMQEAVCMQSPMLFFSQDKAFPKAVTEL